MAIPPGFYGRLAPRSGLAVKKGIHVGAGVIDPDYRGEVRVLLFNLGKEDFAVAAGDRIAQVTPLAAQPRSLGLAALIQDARVRHGS